VVEDAVEDRVCVGLAVVIAVEKLVAVVMLEGGELGAKVGA